MSVSFDLFTGAFLSKVTEYEFLNIGDYEMQEIIDGFMKRSVYTFSEVCDYNLITSMNGITRSFDVDIEEEDVDEIVDIVSEGMLVQWMKPYVYKQENLENTMNTKDFSTYSPSELLMRIGDTYRNVKRDFTNMMREYSYRHGDLGDLHI